MGPQKRILGIAHLENNETAEEEFFAFLVKSLEKLADDIIICKKQTAETQEKISDYDIVWCFDDNFFGPFYNSDEFLKSLTEEECDFTEILDGHFIQINNTKLLSSEEWENIINGITDINDILWIMNDKGMRGIKVGNYNESLEKIPLFAGKEQFLDADLNVSSCENPRKLMDYIHNETSYDTGMIWRHLLKTENVQDIKNAQHLEYIFNDSSFAGDRENICSNKAALIVHLHYEDRVNECFEYLRNVPNFIDLYITTSNDIVFSEAVKKSSECIKNKYEIRWKENRGRDVSSLLVACSDILMKYEFIGFVHDKKSEKYLGALAGNSFQNNIWENLVKSEQYLYNVFDCFIKNPLLGLMVPPEPYYSSLLGSSQYSWKRSYENVVYLAGELGLQCNISKEKLPICFSTSFWCRSDALKNLFTADFAYEDFQPEPMDSHGTISHSIELILAYAAQSEGYYTGIVMNQDYASLRGNGLQMLLLDALREIRKEAVVLKQEHLIRSRERARELDFFCYKFKYIYIYGTGTYAVICTEILDNHCVDFSGYIVSDNKENSSEWNGKPVYKLSEIRKKQEQCGIILALNSGNQKEVLPVLKQRGFINTIGII